MIVALAGRRIDAPDAEEKRFPLGMIDVVYQRILAFFREHNADILISSAACGADLLAQKAARELGIEQHIILPFERGKFRKTSVADRPGDWGGLFDEICVEAETKGNLFVLKGQNNNAKAYTAATDEILNHAEALRAKREKEEILAVIVWEGKAKNENDETAAFAEKARMKNINTEEILTTNRL